MSIKVFISHSTADKIAARRLSRDLQSRGISPWIDEDRLELGASLPKEIKRAVETSDFVLVLLSPSAVSSDWVLKESELAIEQEKIRGSVVLIPVLIAECEKKMFNDRYCVDLASDDRRPNRLDRLVRKLKGEPILERETEEALAWVDQIPLTQLWRKALSVGRFSASVQAIIQKALNSMRPGLDTWNLSVTVSYLSLMMELRNRYKPCEGVSEMMRRIVEDKNVAPFLRHITLLTLLVDHQPALENGLVLPHILGADDDPEFVKEVIDRCIGIAEKKDSETKKSDIEATRQAVAKWICRGQFESRQSVSSAIDSRIRDMGLEPQNVIEQRLDDVALLDETNVLEWFNSVALTLQKGLRGKRVNTDPSIAQKHLRTLTDPRTKNVDLEAIIRVFREASEAEQRNEFGLYVQLTEFLEKEKRQLIRDIRGDDFLFSFVVAVVVDPDIEVTMSALMTQVLLSEFGQEALLLDDRVIDALFEKKKIGKFKLSVVEALIDSIRTDSDDGSSLLILVALYNMAPESKKQTLRRMAHEDAGTNKELGYLEQYFKGTMTIDDIRKRLSD